MRGKESCQMKKNLKLINEYRTPEEWKERAKKIAKGKGIYARVKTNSWWKIAIAAAIALAVCFEGFMLLRGSNGLDINDSRYAPATTESDDDKAVDTFLKRQRLANYYPGYKTEELEKLADKYHNNGCGLIFTRDNGIAQSCSERMKEYADCAGIGELVVEPYNQYNPSCEGYLTDGDTLTVYVCLMSKSNTIENIDNYKEWNVDEQYVPHACIYNKNTGETITPESIKMTAYNGFVSRYIKIEVDLNGKLPEGGFDDLIADVHLYEEYALTDENGKTISSEDIKDTNDVRYGYYHIDVKVEPSEKEINVSNADDAFDIITEHMNGEYFARYLSIDYYHNDVATELVTGKGKAAESDVHYQAGETAAADVDKGYTNSVRLESKGYMTDGLYFGLFVDAKAASQLGKGNNDLHLRTRCYLMPEGKELELEMPAGVCGYDDGTERMYVTIKPQYMLAGKRIETHIYADGENYAEDSLHYVFTCDIPEDTGLYQSVYSYWADWKSNNGKYEYDNPFKGKASSKYSLMGVLIEDKNNVFDEHIKAVEKMPAGTPLLVIVNEWGDNEDPYNSDVHYCIYPYGKNGDEYYCDEIVPITDLDGKLLGYYAYYGGVLSAWPTRVAFYDQTEAMEQLKKDYPQLGDDLDQTTEQE